MIKSGSSPEWYIFISSVFIFLFLGLITKLKFSPSKLYATFSISFFLQLKDTTSFFVGVWFAIFAAKKRKLSGILPGAIIKTFLFKAVRFSSRKIAADSWSSSASLATIMYIFFAWLITFASNAKFSTCICIINLT